MSKRYAGRRYAGGLGPSRVRTRIFLGLVGEANNGCRFAKFYACVCDNNFPSLVASLFSWRCLAAFSYSFLHAAMNLRPPSVIASTHTLAFNAISLYIPPLCQTSGCRSVRNPSTLHPSHPRPLRTAPSRFPNMIRFGSRPLLMRMSVPAHKNFLVRNVSMLSHRARLYEVIRWSSLVRCAAPI